MSNEEINFIRELIIKLDLVIASKDDELSSEGYKALLNFTKEKKKDDIIKALNILKKLEQKPNRRNGKHLELMQKLDNILREKSVAFVFTNEELKKNNKKLTKNIINDIKLCGKYKKDLYLIEEQDLKNILKKYGV